MAGPHAARRVPPLFAPLPAVAPPDNAHVIGSGALGLAGTRALQVAAPSRSGRVAIKGALFTEGPSVNLARDPLLAVGSSAAPRTARVAQGLALRPQHVQGLRGLAPGHSARAKAEKEGRLH